MNLAKLKLGDPILTVIALKVTNNAKDATKQTSIIKKMRRHALGAQYLIVQNVTHLLRPEMQYHAKDAQQVLYYIPKQV